jgi:hypothetical protein
MSVNGYIQIPRYPVEMRFYPKPATIHYTVDRNGDSAVDGTGTTGTLRYCLTNCTASDNIVFADTLTDSASSGCPDLVELTSVLPTKVANIYVNRKYISISPLANFRVTPSTCVWYSAYFVEFFYVSGSSSSIFATGTFNGCLFERFELNAAALATGNGVTFNYCHFREYKTTASSLANGNSVVLNNCVFDKVSSNTQLFTDATITESVFNGCSVIAATASTIKKCTIIRCTSIYTSTPNLTLENNIIIDTPINNSGGASSNRTVNIFQNTIIIHQALAQIFNRVANAGVTVTCNFKNNLIIAPACTYIFSTAAPTGTFTLTETGNTYMAVNADAQFGAGSQRVTTSVSTLISLCDRKKDNKYGTIRPYYLPKGVALNYCSVLASPTDDFLSKTRGATTDCGAIDTEGT